MGIQLCEYGDLRLQCFANVLLHQYDINKGVCKIGFTVDTREGFFYGVLEQTESSQLMQAFFDISQATRHRTCVRVV